MADNNVPATRESATKAWVAGAVGVALAALWVFQPAVAAGDVNGGTWLNAIIAALVSFGALFGGTYYAPNKTLPPK
jgi:hypothetical protein